MALPRIYQKLFQNEGASSVLRPDIVPACDNVSISNFNSEVSGEYTLTGDKKQADGYPYDTSDPVYLKVINTGSAITQYWYHNGALLVRYKIGSGEWSAWEQVGKEVDDATTSTSGIVKLASDTDITNAVIGKVVDAAQLASVKSDLSQVYKYKGSVATYADLPDSAEVSNGDVYNVVAAYGDIPAGTNYAAIVESGNVSWDALGGSIDLNFIEYAASQPADDDVANGHIVFFPATDLLS